MIRSHRKGWKKRPECNGSIRPLDTSLLYPSLVESEGGQQSRRSKPEDETGLTIREAAVLWGVTYVAMDNRSRRGTVPSHLGTNGMRYIDLTPEEIANRKAKETAIHAARDVAKTTEEEAEEEAPAEDLSEEEDIDPDDPERIARQLYLTRYGSDVTLMDRDALGVDDLPPGGDDIDWAAETGAQVPISQESITVSLPVSSRLIYDWAKTQGWHVGDRSFSAFIVDVLFNHFNQCWGMGIFVAPLEEINREPTGTGVEFGGPAPKGAGANSKKAK